ncbi:TetR family transcriptional regulator [Nocardioides albertanoniae]|uniref:TetR family transcriptional regulator n=1 Tax=Nocardioides albertanoniae TaxID=1175486 RepID=A0A543A5Y3_9ACTN|nr:TetR/AcrR family transcriptional regulator [Nocardioides albertanoniae]TQL67978.1 TetR family transcriptional regulator [Nocardioides albertanoniae]
MSLEVDPQRSAGRRWAKTEETRRQLLDASSEVFAEKGYTVASVSDVVARAESSVGSVYHHFGGKEQLYLALWEEYVGRLAAAAAASVAKARKRGVEAPLDQFEAGALAYLDAVWEDRELLPVFYAGDGPPGFEVMRRRRNIEWIRRNLQVLGLGGTDEDQLLGAILTALIGEAARMTAACETKRQARAVAKHAIALAQRLFVADIPADAPQKAV